MNGGFDDDDGSGLLTFSGNMGWMLRTASHRVNIQILRLRNLHRTPTNGMHAWINNPTFLFTLFFLSIFYSELFTPRDLFSVHGAVVEHGAPVEEEQF